MMDSPSIDEVAVRRVTVRGWASAPTRHGRFNKFSQRRRAKCVPDAQRSPHTIARGDIAQGATSTGKRSHIDQENLHSSPPVDSLAVVPFGGTVPTSPDGSGHARHS